jgi:hypothetical protein
VLTLFRGSDPLAENDAWGSPRRIRPRSPPVSPRSARLHCLPAHCRRRLGGRAAPRSLHRPGPQRGHPRWRGPGGGLRHSLNTDARGWTIPPRAESPLKQAAEAPVHWVQIQVQVEGVAPSTPGDGRQTTTPDRFDVSRAQPALTEQRSPPRRTNRLMDKPPRDVRAETPGRARLK